MFNLPPAGCRPASVRPHFASLLAAFFLLHQLAILPASAQPFTYPRPEKRMPVARSSPADTGAANISVTTLGSPITQNFDTLPASGSATWTNDSTLPGWYHARTGTGTTIIANDGSSNAGNLYSYGTGTATDRALGSVGSGNAAVGNLFWGIRLTNNTGTTITSLDVSYVGEQWRNSAAAAQTVAFSYLVGSPTVTGSLAEFQSAGVAVAALDFTSPITGGTAGALNGNLAANRVARSSTISGLNIPNGTEIMLRWSDPDHTGADHGLSIDDFSVTANASAPTTTLSINDVSQDEGDAGTTAFTFTVSLNTTTHGGVTFDIATADGTAQDGNPGGEDNDYQANSLTGQTIPNGSDTYQFTVNVNGDTTTEPNETFTVNVTNVTGASVSDGQGQGAIVNDDVTLTPIHDLQGNGASSPLAGQTVTTTGIVTLLRTGSNAGNGAANGFFLQAADADADADPNTSEGIFVFTSSVPAAAVGDEVRVTGTVVEFNGLTEITSVTNVSVIDTGNPLPTPVTLDATILDPAASPAQPQLERFEGMRLAAAALRTVAPNDNFFDVETVLSTVPRPLREPGIPVSDPVPPDPTSGLVDPNIAIWDENPERLSLDTNGRAGAPNTPSTSNVTFTGVSGPLDFAFGRYRLIPDAAPTATPNIAAVAVPAPAANEFTVASYNIENFNNNATQRQKAALTVRALLHYPDIIGAVEIFDLADLQALRDQINNDAVAAGDPNPMYEAFLVEQDGTSEDNDQDVGFLVKTSRVAVTSVMQERAEETFINPNTGQPEILHDRPPLVLDAVVDPAGASPQRVLVVVNHLRSFIDIELVAGEGVRVREKRKRQAESLADLLQDLQLANAAVPIISVGDYNAFQFSSGYDDSVSVIKGAPTPDDQIVVDQSPDLLNPDFLNLIDELPAAERYSFIFEGTPQALDHHLVNTAARARNTRTAIARVNADFPEAPAATYASNAAVPERNSDHDPVVSFYALGAGQAAGSVQISEFRLSGPAGDEDEFIELYNSTDSEITVATLDGSAGWALATSNATVLHTVPNGTVIPARGHYLVANSDGYSLSAYASPDATYTFDITDGAGLALFRTANPAFFDLDHRLDAAGYASAGELYREGAGIPITGAEINTPLEHSLVRQQIPGLPVDTGDNAADFIGVSTNGSNVGGTPRLGAPGPENLASHLNRNAQLPGFLLDATQPAPQPPNRVRDLTPGDPATANFGTLSLRRRFVNETGAAVTALRFRIAQITTFPAPTGTADLRALSSVDVMVSNITDAATCAAAGESPPCTVNVQGMTLDEPPVQAAGGGWNTSLSVPVELAPGDSVNVEFRLGVQQTGFFRFYVNVEAVTESNAANAPARKAVRRARPRRK